MIALFVVNGTIGDTCTAMAENNPSSCFLHGDPAWSLVRIQHPVHTMARPNSGQSSHECYNMLVPTLCAHSTITYTIHSYVHSRSVTNWLFN